MGGDDRSLRRDQLPQKILQLPPIRGGNPREEPGFGLIGHLAGAGQSTSPLRCRAKRVGTAVVGVALSLDESLSLEAVDDRHHRRSVYAHSLAEALL